MKKLKKQHHYVWKYYLSSWTDLGKIWCLRKGKLFNTSLNNIAQQRYFYEAEILTDCELEFLSNFVKFGPKKYKKFGEKILTIYVLSSYSEGYNKKCIIEDFHSKIESKAISALNELRKGNFNIMNKEEDRANFLLYLGMQYTRTKKRRDNFENIQLSTKSINTRKISKLLSLILGNVVADNLYHDYNLILLQNKSEIDFITSDQPVVNIDSSQEPEELNLYFAISTKYALLFNKEWKGIKNVDHADVKKFNELINFNSHNQLFSKSEKSLMHYQ